MAADALAAAVRPCERDGEITDTFGAEHPWQCGHPGAIEVDGRLLCEDHAGELGYGPKQEEYGYDPDDGLNPTPAADPLSAALAEIRERQRVTFDDPAGRARPHLLLAVKVAREDVPRLLAALDAVLARHALTALHRHTEACPAHYASMFGRGECPDCRVVEWTGCETCRDEFGNPARPEDCRERAVILAALTGKDKAGG